MRGEKNNFFSSQRIGNPRWEATYDLCEITNIIFIFWFSTKFQTTGQSTRPKRTPERREKQRIASAKSRKKKKGEEELLKEVSYTQYPPPRQYSSQRPLHVWEILHFLNLIHTIWCIILATCYWKTILATFYWKALDLFLIKML